MGSKRRKRKRNKEKLPSQIPQIPQTPPDIQMSQIPLPIQSEVPHMSPMPQMDSIEPPEFYLPKGPEEIGQTPPIEPVVPPPPAPLSEDPFALSPVDLKADRFNFLDDQSRRDFFLLRLNGVPPTPTPGPTNPYNQ